jgi:hypothetical protein
MPRPMVTLQLPPGAADAPISHGTTFYRPYPADHRDPASPMLVDVPVEVAIPLLKRGGFFMAKRENPAPAPADTPAREPNRGRLPAGMVRLRHPQGAGCSHEGVSYDPEADGTVIVPHAAIGVLLCHGFALADAGGSPTAPHAVTGDARTAPIVPRRELPPDPPGTPHPDTRR